MQNANTFETLAQTIIENERQMQELAKQVAEQRLAILDQITSAMIALNITAEDVQAHLQKKSVNTKGDVIQADKAEQAQVEQGNTTQVGAKDDKRPTASQDAGKATLTLEGEKAGTQQEPTAANSDSDQAPVTTASKPQSTARNAKFGGFNSKAA